MEILMYLEPAFTGSKLRRPEDNSGLFGNTTSVFAEETPSLNHFKLAIVGLPEYRFSEKNNTENPLVAVDSIRAELYKLFPTSSKIKLLDLGNLKIGKTPQDSLAALAEVITETEKHQITTIMIGGTETLATGAYAAMAKVGKTVSITSVSSRLNIGSDIETLHDTNFMGKLVTDQGEHLFNYANLGYQGYFTQKEELKLVSKLYFEAYRLGRLRKDLTLVEPVLRDTDLAIFNLNAVKQADAPNATSPSPNGLYAEDFCQLAMYSGISDKTSCFGLFGLNEPIVSEQAAMLAAQTVWHFIDGFYRRQKDYPVSELNKYTKFIVNTEAGTQNVVFYKNETGERWWMEVPTKITENEKKWVVACNYNDYKKTCEGLLPDRWWIFFNKLN